MHLEKTVTVLNNSGKIIGTGKTLMNVFQEAKGAYNDKKSQIKNERSSLSRSQTFDAHHHHSSGRSSASRSGSRSRGHHHHHPRHDPHDYIEDDDDYYYTYRDERQSRPRDVYSEAGSRRSASTRRSRSVAHRQPDRESQYGGSTRSRGSALTQRNLEKYSEVSSVRPSRPPPSNHRAPYAETMAISKYDMTHAEMRSLAVADRRPPPTALTRRRSFGEVTYRTHEDDRRVGRPIAPYKEIDMNLAYGDLPPDLEHRHDLDPHQHDEYQAKTLTRKVETLLDEANCLKHSAGATIAHLQKNPDAASAVALTLAELSKVVAKSSPALLTMLKGSSPAVFGLLASPQFMIGTGAIVGLTVIAFGGWKIVQKVREKDAAREAALYEQVPMGGRPSMPRRAPSEYSVGVDEALVVDDELSTIETWRRGIPAFGDDESADLELITPEADRATRAMKDKDIDFDDLRSRRSARTTKTTKTSKTSKSSKSRRDEGSERKSSRHHDSESVAGSERSRKSSSSRRDKAPLKAIEDGRSYRGDDDFDVVFRPKTQRQGSNMLKALFKDKEKELVRV